MFQIIPLTMAAQHKSPGNMYSVDRLMSGLLGLGDAQTMNVDSEM